MKNQILTKAKGRIAPLLCNQNGEVFYEVILKTIIIVVFLLTVINFFTIFVQYQNVNYLCRRTVRAVELEGAVSPAVTATFNELKNDLNLREADFTVSEVNYFNESSKKIQLKNTFTVTVSSNYDMTIFNPVFAPPMVVHIPLRAELTGMSEVFWK